MNQNPQHDQHQNACCPDVCSRYFETGEQILENRYKCTAKKLAAADLWHIQKSKKQVRIASGF